MEDIELLQTWIRVVLVITAICTTSVPIIYLLAPWRTTLVGRLFMLQAVSFAAAIDLSTLFAFWTPSNILVIFWVDVIFLTAIAVSTMLFTAFMVRIEYSRRKARKKDVVQ